MKKQNYVTFNEAKPFVSTMKLKNAKEWEMYCKSGNKPSDIPTTSNIVYKNKGWVSFIDWLGGKSQKFLSFKQAKNIVKKIK
jgi:hypothetical protein